MEPLSNDTHYACNMIVFENTYLSHPVSSQVHKILNHLRAILGTNRFWMELNTPNRQIFMFESHDCFVQSK
jgi:hypothetical protein